MNKAWIQAAIDAVAEHGGGTVVIPNSVTSISNYAFQNCTGLTNITLPADLIGCYNYVFGGCTNLKSIICLSPTARNWNINNFPESVLSRAKLIVPQGKKDTYQSVGGCLSAFTDIKEIRIFSRDEKKQDDMRHYCATLW